MLHPYAPHYLCKCACSEVNCATFRYGTPEVENGHNIAVIFGVCWVRAQATNPF